MNIFLRILVILAFLFISVKGQSVCPFSYKYISESKVYIGLIELKNLIRNSVYNIKVQLVCKEPVDKENEGSIRLVGRENETYIKHVKKESLKFVVNLPKCSNPIQTVRSVTINGKTLCTFSSASRDQVEHIMEVKFLLYIKKNETQNSSVLSTSTKNGPTCGKRVVTTKDLILNGFNTFLGQWPWHVAIYHRKPRQRLYACGGTLIGDYHILTAAHCVTQTSGYVLAPDSLLIQLGAYDLDLLSGESLQEHNIAKITPHPNYDRFSHKNDIAVVKLETKVKFTPYVQPVCLNSQQDSSEFSTQKLTGTLVGWGRTEEGVLSNVLKVASMPFVEFYDCLASNRDVFGQFLSDGMFCAGSRNGTNVCDGDSGGGIFLNINNAFQLVGVTSFTTQNNFKECSSEDYAVFMDIKKYYIWIESITGPLVFENELVEPEFPEFNDEDEKKNFQDFIDERTRDALKPENVRKFYADALKRQKEYQQSESYRQSTSPENIRLLYQFARESAAQPNLFG